MKQCPQCNKTYDDAAIVCAYDGSPLLATKTVFDPHANTLSSSDISEADTIKPNPSDLASSPPLPPIPLNRSSIVAYVGGSPRVKQLDERIAEAAGLPLDTQHDGSLPLTEKAQFWGFNNIAELDEAVKKHGEKAVRLSHYLRMENKIPAGYSIELVFDIMGAEAGIDKFIAYYESLKYCITSPRGWAEGIIEAYEQIKMYGD